MTKNTQKKFFPLVLAFSAFNGVAQITINQVDFPVSQDQHRTTYSWVGNDASYLTPSEGPNQVWDYQGFTNNGLADFQWNAATDPFFVNGYHYEVSSVVLSAFNIPTDIYTGFDNFGYFNYGKQQYDTTFSLTPITGGLSDELHFVDDKQLFSSFSDQVVFPMTYGDQWTDSYFRTTPFEITVAAFGLLNTPGSHKRIVVTNSEVMGHGKLLMSHPTTTISDSMDVLLVNSNYQAIDSFFVGGLPAPAALLSGMGLTQGAVSTTYSSFFYRKGYGDILIEFTGTSFTPGSALVDAKFNVNGIIASSVGIDELENQAVNIYPNPVQSGHKVEIELGQFEIGEMSIVSLSGREIIKLEFKVNDKIEILLPSNLMVGHYFIQAVSKDGTTLFQEKLSVIK